MNCQPLQCILRYHKIYYYALHMPTPRKKQVFCLCVVHDLTSMESLSFAGIECVTSDGIASYSTGEIMECDMEKGIACLNADNDPIPCSDYKIRYFCGK